MPEQDFLTRWYDGWRNLHVRYNYKPHQVAFLARDRSLCGCTRISTDYSRDVMIVHFSAVPKPRDKLFFKQWSKMGEREFLYDVIFTSYLGMFGKERREYAKDRSVAKEFRTMTELASIALKLRDDTVRSGLEWFWLYSDLDTQFGCRGMENVVWASPQL